MTDWKHKSAAYALNSYTWKLLEANLGWDTYQGTVPIIPTAQQPELMQSAKAFIVYGAATQPASHLYALNTDSISYVIYAPTTTEANNVAVLIYETFKRQDESANDVMEWLTVEGKSRGIQFGSVRSVMLAKADPAEDEGGYVSALVILEAKYTTDDQGIQTTGFTA